MAKTPDFKNKNKLKYFRIKIELFLCQMKNGQQGFDEKLIIN